MPGPGPRDFTEIHAAAGLARVVDEARVGGRIGFDTEFLREKTYRAKLCLAQVATAGGLYLVDPLAGADLGELAKLIADESVEVVVHSGRQDFELLYERYGVLPRRVFDVQLAAGFAGLGASLPYGRLVEALTDVDLVKGESYTDWCRRPLSAAQRDYAADDVRYLLEMSDSLRRRLRDAGHLEWAETEMELLEAEDLYRADPEEAWRKVSGRGTLSARQLTILREVARWREEEASRRDLPRGWIVKDQTLIEIARRAPASAAALKSIRGLAPREAERSAAAVTKAIRRGQEAGPMTLPPSPPGRALTRARALSGVADAVVRSRCEAARVAPELVATRGELEALLADTFTGGPDDRRHRLLQGWRRQLAGEAVVAVAEGRVAVRSIDRPPYIEEVMLP